MRKGIIYMIKNKVNNKVYIGQTFRKLSIRIKRHVKDSRYNSELPIHRAIRKYGTINFEVLIIEDNISEFDIDKREIYYINQYKSTNNKYGYNLALGGQGGTAHKTLNENDVMSIIKLLKGTKITFKKIGEKYNVSLSTISDINRGKTWGIDGVVYPVRNNGKRKSINNIKEVMDDICNSNLSSLQIAKKYNIDPTTINAIIRGDIHHNNKLKYPLRERNTIPKTTVKLNKTEVIEIISLLKNTKLKRKEIADKYNISANNITNINHGRVWKDLYNGEYPIRREK